MEWLLGGPQLQNTGSQLGMQVGNTYRVQDTCHETLVELLAKLSSEDRTLRTFRRALGFSQIIQKDLVPLLIHEKNDVKIIDACIRLLVNLTIPVECLLPMEIMARTDAGRHTIYELNNLLFSAKDAFVEPRSTKSILDFMRKIIDQDEKLSLEQCDGINNCLLLVRNILHIPEQWPVCAPTNTPCSKQNMILWNLFAQGIDKVLIYLMTCPQRGIWSITMVQLIALTYKDQHVGTLQKLLNLWFEASLSESSEDNESNTSPPDQGSGDSSPMLTSDPTSDSSDNSSASTNKSNNMDTGCNNKQHSQRMHTDHIKNPNKIAAEIARKAQPAGAAGSGTSRGKGGGGKTQHKKERQQSGEPENQKQQNQSQNSEQALSVASPSGSSGIGGSRTTSSVSTATPQPSPGSSNSNSSGRPPSPVPSTSSSGASTASMQPATPNATQNKPGGPGVTSNPHVKRSCMSSSELSDYGYGTQVENQESVSTSSNEDDLPQKGMKPVHQKPHNPNKIRQHKPPASQTNCDKKEWRRKKLVKRSRTNILNVKALMQHTPTDEDISHLLKEFTVDFLLKGYGPLVQELHLQLLSELGMPVDTSHFFWLVTYFLKFASQLELELENIGPVLSSRVVSYLTFEGVNVCEQLQLALMQQEMDLKPCLRRLHLVVTAVREFIQAVDTYRKSNNLSQEDKDFLTQLQSEICAMGDLRCLFVLLLRQYNPNMQSKQYLQDLIATNHILLLFLENSGSPSTSSTFNMTEHIKHFSTPEMMLQYGRLLESFRENGKFVNDCVFTMMHHISGDMNQVGSLFQPGILKTFSLIWEEDFEVCDDWSDLIEYVIHKFVNTPRRGHPMLPLSSVDAELKVEEVPTARPQPPTLEQNLCRWTKEECDILYWYYVQSAQSTDPIDNIRNMYVENGSSSKTRVAIIEQLYTQDIIPHAQYLELLKQEAVVSFKGLQGTVVTESMEVVNSSGTSTPTILQASSSNLDSQEKQQQQSSDDIGSIIALLIAENHASQMSWLQSALLETCYVKLHYRTLQAAQNNLSMEPVPFHYTLMRQSVPLVPWNLEQSTMLAYPPFVLLLHKLGLQLPGDVGKVFPRIPHFWTAEVLYATALKLGPINSNFLKFDPQELSSSSRSGLQVMPMVEVEETSLAGPSMSSDVQQEVPAALSVQFAPMPEGNTNWMQLVTKAKRSSREQSPCGDLDSTLSKMSISDDDTCTSANEEKARSLSPPGPLPLHTLNPQTSTI
ncbi:protein timeless isoform X2 [Neocloeon triangulifer]|uniref:protein timeless isoform X2 n=1 Tax=Neocloeon triangulifer TaxID=2078957 RepID=UPI00286ED2C9|nr:protein timeless isoform X2 [Neocloeon triangulifer]